MKSISTVSFIIFFFLISTGCGNSQTHTPTTTPTYANSFEARNVKCKNGFTLELPVDILRASNDKWTIFTCSPPATGITFLGLTLVEVDYGERYTQIIKTDLSKTWTIQHNDFEYSRINRPDALMMPYQWTKDGNYLYLYPVYYPGGSGHPQSAFLYSGISDLYRINLETGKFELFLQREQFTDIAFSPDDQFFIYSERNNPNLIHVKNMITNQEQQLNLGENIFATGAFIWNSESTKVVFFVGYENKSENWQNDLSSTSIFILSPQNMHIQNILEKDVRKFAPDVCPNNEYWVDENTICVYSVDRELGYWENKFTLNITTGTLESMPHP
ncbi:MAG: hypothetical protein HC797_08675 [Anaerolineales bacterium]|nr:hypothetical protein [Anaerolineales bacterium]